MAIRFTIGRKIGLGFGLFIVLTMVAFILTVLTVNDSKKQTETVVGQVAPSVAELKELNLLLQRSHTNVSKWFYNKSFNDIEFRDELKNIIRVEYPEKKKLLQALSSTWSQDEKTQLKVIFGRVETLFKVYQNEIISQLNSLQAYEDPNIYMMARLPYEDSEVNIKTIYRNLNSLIAFKQEAAETVKDNMFKSFNFLNRFVQLLGITLVVGGIMIALYTTRSITKPIKVLKKMLLSMGLGILPKERIQPSSDEVGEMGIALNELIQSMQETTKFAKETGAGKFDANFKPLSKDDSLGQALLKMRDDLAENERSLERKVNERTEEVVRQKSEIENKNEELQILYKQVTDSIHYAKRIQEAILPPQSLINRVLPNSFVLFKPKDIVSGDFYWIEKKNNTTYFAAVDCTGHGVPGAFMSLVGHNILKDILNNTEVIKPSEILDKLRDGVINTLHINSSGTQSKDGMDITLCCINFDTLELQYAAAYNPLYIVRGGELIIHPANKFPIGAFVGEKQNFDNITLQLKKNDQIYIYSDGYADQFGGPRGKKFMVGNFRKLLTKIADKPIHEQLNFLESTLTNWQGELEQVDDVLIIGLKI
ncbi:MAG: SpoIIE family protein phosphatase [Bacteroidota bacterium]|nr:SpoIIE family protein phosphatase [Bacteroidota bacterium]MDP3145630.1 SpoIIE family protein phosphatase [Bacteroidota bacterium]MDP3558697.1 SpoIIE family protein phosphatase [Bacteroidota bacterium]